MSLPSGVHLFYGNDVHKMDTDIERMIERVLPDEGTRPFNLEQLDGDGATVASVLMLAMSLPFMAKRRAIVVREPAFLLPGAKKKGLLSSEDEKEFLAFCANPNPDSLLLLRLTTEEAPNAFLKKVIVSATSSQCNEPKGRDVGPWLRAEAKKRGLSFSPSALFVMGESAPQGGTMALSSELDKLALYLDSEGRNEITDHDIATIVTPTPSHTIFNLTDAFCEGRVQEALASYHDVLLMGTKSIIVLRQLLDTVRRLLEVQAMANDGMSLGDIKNVLKRHEFYVKKLMNQARRLDARALAKCYCYLVESDVKSKSTAGLDMDVFTEDVLLQSCAILAGGRKRY